MLPEILHPTYTVKIPSNGKSFTFRPYTIKEQKILLMLKDSQKDNNLTETELIDNIKNLIEACCTDKSTSNNFNTLTQFDIEYILLKIRAKSVNETSIVQFTCHNIPTTVEKIDPVDGCGTINRVSINLDQIEVDFSKAAPKELSIQNDITMVMNYPTSESMADLGAYYASKDLKDFASALYRDTKFVTMGDKKYDEFTEEEFLKFLESLNISSLETIINFYLNQPVLRKTVDFTCSACGYKEQIILTGINDFFD